MTDGSDKQTQGHTQGRIQDARRLSDGLLLFPSLHLARFGMSWNVLLFAFSGARRWCNFLKRLIMASGR